MSSARRRTGICRSSSLGGIPLPSVVERRKGHGNDVPCCRVLHCGAAEKHNTIACRVVRQSWIYPCAGVNILHLAPIIPIPDPSISEALVTLIHAAEQHCTNPLDLVVVGKPQACVVRSGRYLPSGSIPPCSSAGFAYCVRNSCYRCAWSTRSALWAQDLLAQEGLGRVSRFRRA